MGLNSWLPEADDKPFFSLDRSVAILRKPLKHSFIERLRAAWNAFKEL